MNERMVERSDEVGCYMHCISHMNVLRFIWHSLRIFHHSTYLFTHLGVVLAWQKGVLQSNCTFMIWE